MQNTLTFKKLGQDAVERHSGGWVGYMRDKARSIIRLTGQVTIDDLRVHAMLQELQPHDSHAWGAVFTKGFVCIGRTRSTWEPNHGREIKVWTNTTEV